MISFNLLLLLYFDLNMANSYFILYDTCFLSLTLGNHKGVNSLVIGIHHAEAPCVENLSHVINANYTCFDFSWCNLVAVVLWHWDPSCEVDFVPDSERWPWGDQMNYATKYENASCVRLPSCPNQCSGRHVFFHIWPDPCIRIHYSKGPDLLRSAISFVASLRGTDREIPFDQLINSVLSGHY